MKLLQEMIRLVVNQQLKETRNMYGEITNPEYYIQVRGLDSYFSDEMGPYDSKREAEQAVLDSISSIEWNLKDEKRFTMNGEDSWVESKSGTEYWIREREKEEEREDY